VGTGEDGIGAVLVTIGPAIAKFCVTQAGSAWFGKAGAVVRAWFEPHTTLGFEGSGEAPE
jgi:hypothetical protein